MPTYAYACTACGHRFEVQQSFTDSALTDCPECAGRLRKLFNNVGIVFKGSGFYRTDSRTAPSTGSSDAGSSGSSTESAPSSPATPAATPAAASTSGSSSSAGSSPSSGSSSSGSSSAAKGSTAPAA